MCFSAVAEIHYRRIASADEDSDTLAGLRLIAAREQRGEGRSAARFGHDTQNSPERFLRLLNGRIGNQQHPLHMRLCDGEHELAHALRGQRVGGYASGLTV